MAWSGNSPNRIRGRTWANIRAAVLAEEPICRACIAGGNITKDSASTVCDHITPLFEGGTDDRSNLAGMCKPCHDAKTAAESARALGRPAPKLRLPVGVDGWPIKRADG